MSRQDHGGKTPQDVVRGAMGVDPDRAHEVPASQGEADVESGAPLPTQQEVAEQTKLSQEARPDGRPDRDDRLTHVGRGRQTTGR